MGFDARVDALVDMWLPQIEVIRANVVGTLTLADVTNERGIHLCIYATGCIFHYDKDFPQDSGKGFTEDDTPNFLGSYYSRTKVPLASAPPIARVSQSGFLQLVDVTKPLPL